MNKTNFNKIDIDSKLIIDKSILFNEEEKDFFIIAQDVVSDDNIQDNNSNANSNLQSSSSDLLPYQRRYKPKLTKYIESNNNNINNINNTGTTSLKKRGSITYEITNQNIKYFQSNQQFPGPNIDLQENDGKSQQLNMMINLQQAHQVENSINLEHNSNNSLILNVANSSPKKQSSIVFPNQIQEASQIIQQQQFQIQTGCIELTQEQILHSAIQILKRRNAEHRSDEEINILMKATESMNFFQKILSKKTYIENNLHSILCKAMHYKHLKKGNIVFYEGDSADYFYILLKGEVVILIPKNEQELQKDKRKQEVEYPQPGLPPKLQFKIRKYLFLKHFQRIVTLIINALRFFSFMKQDCLEYRSIRKKEKELEKQKMLDSQSKDQFTSMINLQSNAHLKNSQVLSQTNAILEKKIQNISAIDPKTIVHTSLNQNKDNQSQQQPQKLSQIKNPQINQTKTMQDEKGYVHSTFDVSSKLGNIFHSVFNQIGTHSKEIINQDGGQFNKNVKNDKVEQSQLQNLLLDPVNKEIAITQQQKERPQLLRESQINAQNNNQINEQNQNKQEGLEKAKKAISKVKQVINITYFTHMLANKQINDKSQSSIMGPFGARIYKEIRESLLHQIPKFDIEKISNPAHFFVDNTFKYNIAVVLDQGYVFGELGILNKKPRAGTIVCLEDTYFAMLSAQDYEKILMKMEKMKLLKKVRFIAQAMNMNLSIEKMSKLSYIFSKKKYNVGEKIYMEGDQSGQVFLLKKGTVELLKTVEVSTDFNEKVNIQARIAQIGSNEFFGEDDAFFGRKHNFTAVAVEDLCVFHASSNQFLKYAGENYEMQQILYQRMQAKEQRRNDTLQEIVLMREKMINLGNLKKTFSNINQKRKGKTGHKSFSYQLRQDQINTRQQQAISLSKQLSERTATRAAAELFQKESNQLPTYNKLKIKTQRFQKSNLIDKNTIKQQDILDNIQNQLEFTGQLKFSQQKDINQPEINNHISPQQIENPEKKYKLTQLLQPLTSINNTKNTKQPLFFSHVQPTSIKKIVQHNHKVLKSHVKNQDKLNFADLYKMTREIALLNNNQLQKMEVVQKRRNQMEIERIEKKCLGEYTNYNTINYIHCYQDYQLQQILNQQVKNQNQLLQLQQQQQDIQKGQSQNQLPSSNQLLSEEQAEDKNYCQQQNQVNKQINDIKQNQAFQESLLMAQTTNFYKGTLFNKLKSIEDQSIYDKPDAELFVSQVALTQRKQGSNNNIKNKHYKSCSMFGSYNKNQTSTVQNVTNNNSGDKGGFTIQSNGVKQFQDKSIRNLFSPTSTDYNKSQQHIKTKSNLISDNLKTDNDIDFIPNKLKYGVFDTNIIQTSRFFDKQSQSNTNIQGDQIYEKVYKKYQKPIQMKSKLEIVSHMNSPRDQSTEIDFMINGLIVNQGLQNDQISTNKNKSGNTIDKLLMNSQQQIPPPYIEFDNFKNIQQKKNLKSLSLTSKHFYQNNSSNNSKYQLCDSPASKSSSKIDKLIIINHMQKPITFTAKKE